MPENKPTEIHILEFLKLLDAEFERIGWSEHARRLYVNSKYNKLSRLALTDEQLLELYQFLKSLPNKGKEPDVNVIIKAKNKRFGMRLTRK